MVNKVFHIGSFDRHKSWGRQAGKEFLFPLHKPRDSSEAQRSFMLTPDSY